MIWFVHKKQIKIEKSKQTSNNCEMGRLTLYGMEASPPFRAVKLTLHALNLPYEIKMINLLAGDNKTSEFLKINPQHTVPVLEDDGHYIWDSHAICAYLVGKYAKTDCLYPKDLLKRAIVDQRLHFDTGVLFHDGIRSIARPLFYENSNEVSKKVINHLYGAYNFLETFLNNQEYLCGGNITIADFSCISTISSLIGLAPIDALKYPNLSKWFNRITKLPYYRSANGNGAEMLVNMLNEKAKNVV